MTPERYTDWEWIGSGAMAEVWRCHDRELAVMRAVKLLKPAVLGQSEVVEGIKAEVRISQQLYHPTICPIYDLYQGPRGFGIVMAFIDGCTLRQWMDRNKGDLAGTRAQRLDVLRRVADALEVAHRLIVHRDMKPANIMLHDCDPSRPVIMDFGISVEGRVAGRDHVAGTPKYMAPEQYEAPETVDKRADLFALGIMAYELFTHTIAPTSLRTIADGGPMPPRDALSHTEPPSRFCMGIPSALDHLILSMMAFAANDRPASAGAVAEALKAVAFDDDIVFQPNGADERVLVPAGAAMLGSNRPNAEANRKPARKVELDAFQLSAHPVTNAQYRRFIAATGLPEPPFMRVRGFHQDDVPVVGVTWQEACLYAQSVGGRLPTEAEWEAAAKAGRKFVDFPWGDESPTSLHANIGNTPGPSPVRGHPGGKNPLGLWDMCGNVWEWCQDVWSASRYEVLANGVRNPVHHADKATQRVLRGGAFSSMHVQGQCSFRFFGVADVRRNDVGFRVAYAVSPGGNGEGA